MGTRSQINPFDLKSRQMMTPLSKGHSDIITSIAALTDQSLISIGKEGSIRHYSKDLYIEQNQVVNVHPEQISCVETNDTGFLTGFKDGIVKEWNSDLKCTTTIESCR
jgi:hypothetical protein